MSHQSNHIRLSDFLASLEMELEDLYADGVLSAAIYNKKQPKRLLIHALNRADRYICMERKVSRPVSIYMPSGLSTVFYGNQLRNIDILSSISDTATAYDSYPIKTGDSGIRLTNAMPIDTESPQEKYAYQVTGGEIKETDYPGKRFYVEPNTQKITISGTFSSGKWIRLTAQIAPVEFKITEATTEELDEYRIVCPYYYRRWLTDRSMIELLSNRTAAAAGLYEAEAKSRAECIRAEPGTGNVILRGDEMSGNYEGNFEDF